MNVQRVNESRNYRKAARNLFSEINKLMQKASKSADQTERRELYLRAMSISNEAYILLGKAKKLSAEKPPAAQVEFSGANKAYLSGDN